MELTLTQSKGLRNDTSRKFVPSDYFYEIENFNYDDIIGASRILFPAIKYNASVSADIDGIFEFTYVNNSSVSVNESIAVVNGLVVKDFLTSPVTIYTGLTAGHKCTFAILNDQLFISNGHDNILVYSNIDGTPVVKEMGAPYARDSGVSGLPDGEYYYALTYVVSGVELITGTVSNTLTVVTNQINLSLPVGPTDTDERKVYRTEDGGSTLKLVTTIADNTTTTYTDNTADGSLGATMGAVNSAAPKPQFISVKNERLIGVKNSARPNYFYASETEVEVIYNTIGVSDVSGQGNDNSPLKGMALDYDQIVVFSEKSIYLISLGTATTVQQTNANIGCLDGFSIAKIPENAGMPGGLMFVSNEYDIRIFNGNIATTLATSLDNLKTENFSEVLNKNDLKNSLTNVDVDAVFFDYKYHLIIRSLIYIFDIRILGWTTYRIQTTTYTPTYNKFGLIDGKLYVGQSGAGIVEQMYADTVYRTEAVTSEFVTPSLLADNQYKDFKELHFYYGNSGAATTNIIVTPDNNANLAKVVSFTITGDGFDSNYFDPTYFQSSTEADSYKVLHIDMTARWLTIRVNSNGLLNFRGYRLVLKQLNNQED
tara:strand:- start:847 stop:2640 length:1794 start_codon:yes stop_codon:yes gene_type:complete